jgi:mono/diheme cytochrome c family protein
MSVEASSATDTSGARLPPAPWGRASMALRPDAAAVGAVVSSGRGGMPAFGGDLSSAEIQAVADYVAGAAGQ